jgi:tetrahydromethanopterin S-methyltransferase subunit A
VRARRRERGRIQGAQGKWPVLKNVSRAQVEAFRRQVVLRSLIGVTDEEQIAGAIADCARLATEPLADAAPDAASPATIAAVEPSLLVSDPAGFVVVYPDARRDRLIAEHYTNAGTLDCVVEGRTPAAVYTELIARSFISRLDHAAYIGRELARAERSLATGEPYVQDRAAGECGCHGGCE